MKERLASLLFRAAFHLASNRHAYWLYRVQRLYWEGSAGREVRRRLEDGDGTR